MPEFQAPGVYVVEIESSVGSIPGVPTHIDDEELRSMTLLLRERLARYSPGWTETNDSDPGVMLLEVLAWLGDRAEVPHLIGRWLRQPSCSASGGRSIGLSRRC